jgi:hypothetical protein
MFTRYEDLSEDLKVKMHPRSGYYFKEYYFVVHDHDILLAIYRGFGDKCYLSIDIGSKISTIWEMYTSSWNSREEAATCIYYEWGFILGLTGNQAINF